MPTVNHPRANLCLHAKPVRHATHPFQAKLHLRWVLGQHLPTNRDLPWKRRQATQLLPHRHLVLQSALLRAARQPVSSVHLSLKCYSSVVAGAFALELVRQLVVVLGAVGVRVLRSVVWAAVGVLVLQSLVEAAVRGLALQSQVEAASACQSVAMALLVSLGAMLKRMHQQHPQAAQVLVAELDIQSVGDRAQVQPVLYAQAGQVAQMV